MLEQPPVERRFALATWKQLIDLGSMQDGEEHLRATARPAGRQAEPGVVRRARRRPSPITGDRGAVTLPAEAVEGMPDGVVWVPANSFGSGRARPTWPRPGSRVHVREAIA